MSSDIRVTILRNGPPSVIIFLKTRQVKTSTLYFDMDCNFEMIKKLL